MTYTYDGRTYPRFRELFYRCFDVQLSELPTPPFMDILPGRAQPPLGYLRIGEGDGRRFVPDPERAALIAQAFGLVAGGTGFQTAWRTSVSAGLTGRGGKPVSASGLLHVLRNPAYMGLLRYGQELYAGAAEPLVSETTFKRGVIELDRQVAAFHKNYEERNRKYFSILLRARELGREATRSIAQE